MNKCLCLSFCLFLVCLSSLHAQQSRQELESQIIALEHRYWEAWKDRDAKTLAQIRGENFREADHDGVWDKKQTEQGDLDLETTAFTMSNEKVSLLQPNVALLTYEIAYKSSYKGKDISSSHSYIASLYARHKGDWQLVYMQESLANDSQATESADTTLPADQLSVQALAKEREIQEAQKQGDWQKFADLLSDDLVAIDEDGIHSKKELLEEIRTSDFHLSDYKMEDVMTIPEGNGAIVAYKQTHVGTEHGKPFALHINTHSNWQRRGDKWVVTMFQDSTAKEDTPADDSESDEAVMKAIVANEQKIFETFKRNDIAAFGNMLPEDVIMVEDDGIHTKTVWLKELEEQKKTGLLFTDLKMEDLRLVRHSPSAATLVFRETIHGLQGGKQFQWHINGSSGYVNRGGKWVPILYQDVMAK